MLQKGRREIKLEEKIDCFQIHMQLKRCKHVLFIWLYFLPEFSIVSDFSATF